MSSQRGSQASVGSKQRSPRTSKSASREGSTLSASRQSKTEETQNDQELVSQNAPVETQPPQTAAAPQAGQPKLNIEDKLDEDFMEILSFVKINIKNLCDDGDKRLAQAWLEKLCGEALEGIDAKRSRNIYLSRLACQMADNGSNLNPPFVEPPPEGNLVSAEIMFGLQPPEDDQPPEWLEGLLRNDIPDLDVTHKSRDGRTYLATRQMKGGIGAFGYVAVTVAEGEPLWVEPKDRPSTSPSRTSTKKKKFPVCPGQAIGPQEPVSRLSEEERALKNAQGKLKKSASKRMFQSIEPLLAKRRTQEERDGLLHFYDLLMESIKRESDICGCNKTAKNAHIEQLLEKLEKDLKSTGDDVCDCEVTPLERRKYLLEILYNKTAARKRAVEEREATLDRLERIVQQTDEEEETEEEFQDDSLWTTAAEQGPTEQNMKRLLAVYPPELVERFVELLATWRQDMVRRCRTRHENVVSAMKKDLKAEVKLGLEKYKQARDSWMKVAQALQEVQSTQRQAKEEEEAFNVLDNQKNLRKARSRAKLVNQMMGEFNETQRFFEAERNRGIKLKEQLNVEHQRVEDSMQMSELSLEQLQADGDALHSEIKSLELDLVEQEDRIKELTLIYQSVC